MQDGEEADLHAQTLGIGGNLQQCLGGGSEAK